MNTSIRPSPAGFAGNGIRRSGRSRSRAALPIVLAAAVLLAVAAGAWSFRDGVAASNDYALADRPLYVGSSAPPLMMLVASRDEQLFDKAYADYTDINGDGVVDSTYNNGFDYEGYFDPFLCYAYAAGKFSASGARTGDHRCDGSTWSGNFLNWVAMSRVDILRYVLYGGNRHLDDASQTVLERAHIPNDMHAWVKVYEGADLQKYVGLPVGSGPVSFCNVSFGDAGAPLMRVASGRLTNWAVTEFNQCMLQQETGSNASGDSDRPASATDYVVRVKVCDKTAANDGLRERFCSRYGNSYKPTGVLQEYGESGRLRFGLVSGTYSKPRAGGVLRKNIGLFAGNGNNPDVCAPGDEVRLADGTFCNQVDDNEGIVNTLRRFKIVGWTGVGTNDAWNGPSPTASWGGDCGGWGAMNRTDIGSGVLDDPGPAGSAKCTPWGNPVGEMYAEALRYIAGAGAPASGFADNAALDIRGGRPAWIDPFGAARSNVYGGGNSYCAACSVLILSSGSPTYDGEVPTVSNLGDTAEASTQAVGDAERISGKAFFVGSAAQPGAANLANSSNFVCTAQTISNLAYVRGICNDSPQREGTYLVAGLARAAYAADLRSNNLPNKPATTKINVATYAVELADSLPKIQIPTGAGVISLTPVCKANPQDSYRRTCQLGDALAGKQKSTVPQGYVYGRDMSVAGGSFMFSWDGAPQGESNDQDFTYMLTYCVGAACMDDTNPANNGNYYGYDICWASASAVCGRDGRPWVGPNEVLVRTEMISASSGNPATVGFSISGSNLDGTYEQVLRKNPPDGSGAVYSVLNGATPSAAYPMNDPVNVNAVVWERPSVVKFSAVGSASASLESPLWYAAKYGGTTLDLNLNGRPDWDDDGDGQPDNYLKARNPAKLRAELGRLISRAAGAAPVTGGGGSGARLTAGGSVAIAKSFAVDSKDRDWTGNLIASELDAKGETVRQRWAAATVLAGQAAGDSRNIRTTMAATALSASGAKQADAQVRGFTEKDLRSFNAVVGVKAQLGLTASDNGWLGATSDSDLVAYLRGARNAAPLRVRSALLGDIVNSSVEVVSPKDDFGYGAWSGQSGWRKTLGDSYRTYLAGKRAAAVGTVLAGANDGMLHGFALDSGAERFAFVPSSARERMGQLANPNYRHQFTMDGEIVSADVPGVSADSWRTLAIAASGAGGRSVSALNLTNAAAFNDASVLWELRGTEGTHPVLDDLGFVFGRPVVVPVSGATAGGEPRWVALFGNGANSRNGAPALFVVDVNTGDVLARLKPAGSQYRVRNGLFDIAPVALYNRDGVVDTVYGGDLQGNVWKFDLSAAAISSWNVAFSGAPLFAAKDAAGNPQPITGGLEVARGPSQGTVVVFGTGRYFAVGDNTVPASPQVQSFYGIFDRCAAADCTGNITDGRSGLARQSVTQGATSDGYVTRMVSSNAPGPNGWYLDLRVEKSAATGERFIGTPRLQNGSVFFTSFEPIGDDCRPGGRNWLYGLDFMSGGAAMDGVSSSPGGAPTCAADCGALALEANKGPPITETDVLLPQPAPAQLAGCGAADPNCSDANALGAALAARQCTLILRSEGSKPLYMPRACGRQSWRQVR